jgi:hypothetical protein
MPMRAPALPIDFVASLGRSSSPSRLDVLDHDDRIVDQEADQRTIPNIAAC